MPLKSDEGKEKNKNNNDAEWVNKEPHDKGRHINYLGYIAQGILILGIICTFFILSFAFSEEYTTGYIIATAVLIVSVILWAFLLVFSGMAWNLNVIRSTIMKQDDRTTD